MSFSVKMAWSQSSKGARGRPSPADRPVIGQSDHRGEAAAPPHGREGDIGSSLRLDARLSNDATVLVMLLAKVFAKIRSARTDRIDRLQIAIFAPELCSSRYWTPAYSSWPGRFFPPCRCFARPLAFAVNIQLTRITLARLHEPGSRELES